MTVAAQLNGQESRLRTAPLAKSGTALATSEKALATSGTALATSEKASATSEKASATSDTALAPDLTVWTLQIRSGVCAHVRVCCRMCVTTCVREY